MSEIPSIRTIPARSFSAPFISGQKIIKPTNLAWVPKFTYNGNAIYVTFSAGTVNGFLPTNWNEEFSMPQTGQRYVKLKVTASLEGIQSVEIVVESNPTVKNPYKEEYPVHQFSFILGAVKGTDYSMVFNSNITVNPIEVFRIEKDSTPAPGEDPFTRYYGWSIF